MPRSFALLIALFFLVISPASAKVDLRPKTQKLEDPGSATPLLYKTPAETQNLAPVPAPLQVNATCTDALGMVVKQGDVGFESCLRNQSKMKVQNNNEKNPNSVGITFGN